MMNPTNVAPFVRENCLSRLVRLAFAVLSLCGLVAGHARTWTIADNALNVDFDDRTATFTIVEKASGRTWRQLPARDAYTVDKVESRDGRLSIQLKGQPDLRVTLALAANSDLEMTVDADRATKMLTVGYPGPIETPADDWNLVVPVGEGVLMPVREAAATLRLDRPYPFYNMGGLIMSWVGATDAALRSGYMVIVDTPYDSGIRFPDRGGRPAPELFWQAEMGRFGYTRTLRYHFFAEGGYVAQAKHYRDHVRCTREFSTLRERARQRPHIDQLVGAVHIYTWDDGRDLKLARELKDAGIDRAWVGWDPSHPPYPAKGYDEGLKALGYLAGVYDLYRDCYDDVEWDKKAATNEVLRGMWLHRYPYPGLFQKIVARNADNLPMQIRFSGDVGIMRYWTCTKAQQPYVLDRITRELKTYPHNSVFVDVTLAAGPFECQSPDHPMTRRDDAAARMAIHKLMADQLHMVVGSEWGADYGVAHTEFLHGVMTLHNFYGEGTRDRASPHYHGDWSNTVRPTMMLGEAKPTAAYLKYGVGEYYRIPLFELVYHDCIVSSWRWDENSHKQPDVWARKDLFTALYAVAPQWNLDRGMWQKYRDRFVASFKLINPVLRAVGYDEMLDHRFLTPDRKVQETMFASGKKVIANFDEAPCTVGSTTIPAGGFILTGK